MQAGHAECKLGTQAASWKCRVMVQQLLTQLRLLLAEINAAGGLVLLQGRHDALQGRCLHLVALGLLAALACETGQAIVQAALLSKLC